MTRLPTAPNQQGHNGLDRKGFQRCGQPNHLPEGSVQVSTVQLDLDLRLFPLLPHRFHHPLRQLPPQHLLPRTLHLHHLALLVGRCRYLEQPSGRLLGLRVGELLWGRAGLFEV